MFTTNSTVIAIARCGRGRVASHFDSDGYPFSQAEIRLRDGQRVALPDGTTPDTIASARRMLGL